ncbi:adenosylcobinamide-GDP ribazoletransferase [Oceanicella sp. SM1341]|uniref:adenosylcobinamide-GDP ribazoletransferase n=1 Tax=Oceanicella sp. SM1341 TaxID=1548889 RepID=UPI001E388DA4|nr:adenosylcobinamide-GDP ribazoletransferase [Oceanicella sp. SM1341]
MISPRDPGAAAALLTRLPLPVDHAAIAGRLAASAWAWPLVGALLGAAAGAALVLARLAGLPGGMAAALALALLALATGALHEDGLADCADGFWGGRDRARRLEIMKDSRIGSYGAVALVLVTLARWSALAALPGWSPVAALALAAAASRAAMAVAMRLPNARGEGLSAGVGRPPLAALALGTGLCLLGGGLALGLAGLLACALAAAGGAAVCLLARARLGGQTGDVLGATQQIAETAALAGLVACLG